MTDHASADHIRQLQDQLEQARLETERMGEAAAAGHRDSMMQLERGMIDKFRVLREERGWSQKEMAERVRSYGFDFHQSTVAKLESGGRPLRVAEMYALSHVFQLPPGAVFFMAASTREHDAMDSLTELLETEERQRASMHETLMTGITQSVEILADHQTRINSLVDAMRSLSGEQRHG